MIKIRAVNETELEAVNRLIAAAVMTWLLPERVKRLSLPVYRYNHQDLVHLRMVVAEDQRQHIVGVAAWERADPRDAPAGQRALLLHGIYVEPRYHRQGIGRRLFTAAEDAVGRHHCDGLLVKAQQDATAFFTSLGMRPLPVEEPSRQYANRLWKAIPDQRSVTGD
ncbi:MAG: GNAT family N-acetyltransferase [Gammaproteobacteria bacterium]